MMQKINIQSRINMRKGVKKSPFKEHVGLIKYSLDISIGKEEFDVCISQIDICQHVNILSLPALKTHL